MVRSCDHHHDVMQCHVFLFTVACWPSELTFQAGDDVMVVGYRDGERWKPVSLYHTIHSLIYTFVCVLNTCAVQCAVL